MKKEFFFKVSIPREVQKPLILKILIKKNPFIHLQNVQRSKIKYKIPFKIFFITPEKPVKWLANDFFSVL
jgi:hypothetical protein